MAPRKKTRHDLEHDAEEQKRTLHTAHTATPSISGVYVYVLCHDGSSLRVTQAQWKAELARRRRAG